MNSEAVFFYVHDPMCSWCWGHRPVWDRLQQQLTGLVDVRYCLGGLAPDSDEPMPEATRLMVQGNWQRVTEETGADFNYDFWRNNQPRRSTYPACRAVMAAKWQGAEQAMIDALQRAYYQRALNPSDTEVHLQLAAELNLDVERFTADLHSDALQQALTEDLQFARALPIEGFPSMVLRVNGRDWPIELNYRDETGALAQVKELLGQRS